jgi:hypothetical protein
VSTYCDEVFTGSFFRNTTEGLSPVRPDGGVGVVLVTGVAGSGATPGTAMVTASMTAAGSVEPGASALIAEASPSGAGVSLVRFSAGADVDNLRRLCKYFCIDN